MITTVSCDLLQQATCKLVNSSTTTHDLLLQVTCLLVKPVNSSTTTHDLLLQVTCLLVNLSTRQLPLMIYCYKQLVYS